MAKTSKISPETKGLAKELDIKVAGARDTRSRESKIEDLFRNLGVKKAKETPEPLKFKIKHELEEEAPKVAEGAKGFLSWLGKEAVTVGKTVQTGLQKYSERRQKRIAEEKAAEEAMPKVEMPEPKKVEAPEMKAAIPKIPETEIPMPETKMVSPEAPEVEPVEEPPVHLEVKPEVLPPITLHQKGDLVTLHRKDLNRLLKQSVEHGKLHIGNVKVKLEPITLKAKPWGWLKAPAVPRP